MCHFFKYGAPSIGVLDVKKAIINTILQAFKAIGGGVIALKGQLLKGGGYVISAKGRLLSSAGEAIAGFGKQLAASAVIGQAHPQNTGYSYEAPGGYSYDQPGRGKMFS